MIGPYLVKNPLLYVYLRCLDGLFTIFTFFKKRKIFVRIPQKILVVQWAHMGDVIIATSVLPLLRQTYPKAKIGMLVGSWSREIIENHPMIDYIHVFDHPKINRSSKWLIVKMAKAFINNLKIVKELNRTQYDLSIDVYVYYPNSHYITWCAGISQRLGYISGGGGALLTQSLCWNHENKHMSLYHLDLLRLIGVTHESVFFLKSYLPSVSSQLFQDLKTIWKLPDTYIIFHPYSGEKKKNWPEDFWRKLLEVCSHRGHFVIFTGKSTVEREDLDKISDKKAGCINLAGYLSINELQALFCNAKGLICVDTMVSHLAAVCNLRTMVCIWSTKDFCYWRPASYSHIPLNYQKNLDYDCLIKAFLG